MVVLNLTFPSPYSDMALLPILAFFFCSAGPFLFSIFAARRLFDKIMGRNKILEKQEKMMFNRVRREEEDIDFY